jgi:ABC-type nitrate/sulfonate/bicarbonate transport system substrate-binding protein
VLGSNMALEYVFAALPGFKTPADLVGKRVGISGPGQDTDVLVRTVLSRAHVDPGKVHFSALQDSTSRVAALLAGRLDAAALEYTDLRRLQARVPGVVILGRMSDVKPRSAQTIWVVSRGWAAKHPALLKTTVDGLLDGYRFVMSPAGRTAWIEKAKATVLAGSPDWLIAGTYDYYRSIRFWPSADEPVTPAIHERAVAFWTASGQLEGGVPFAKLWDASLWRAAGSGG